MSSQVILSVGQAPYEEEISHELPWWGQPSPWTYCLLVSAKACTLLHQAFKMHRDGESIGREARLHPGQDTHTPYTHTHTWRLEKINAYMEGIWKFNIEPRTVTRNLVSYVATVLTIASLSLPRSSISQDSVVHKERKKGQNLDIKGKLWLGTVLPPSWQTFNTPLEFDFTHM